MTEPIQLQVRDLLPGSLDIEQTMKEALSKDEGVGRMRLAWGVIGSQATNALNSVLDIDALQLLGRAWCVLKELHEYADRTKHPEGERSVVYLGSHKFKKTVYPELAVAIQPFKPITLRFTLDLLADIQSIALAIANGYVTGTGAGEGALAAQLKYGDLALNKPQPKKVTFPGNVAFKAPGLVIL